MAVRFWCLSGGSVPVDHTNITPLTLTNHLSSGINIVIVEEKVL